MIDKAMIDRAVVELWKNLEGMPAPPAEWSEGLADNLAFMAERVLRAALEEAT